VNPNGGGAYVNNYTFIWDVYVPQLAWTAMFNTNPTNGNDADFYIDPDGYLGIGSLGYTASPVVQAGQWYRLGFVLNTTGGYAAYYLNGVEVYRGGSPSLDGRFSLYASDNAGPDVLFYGEGDSSGNYTNELYTSAIYFTDAALSADQMAALGGPSARGIVGVPEPGSIALTALGAAGLAAWALRRRSA